MRREMGHVARFLLWACAIVTASIAIHAQNRITIDATAAPAAPDALPMALHDVNSPEGKILGANSRYLTLDGKPWIPVMGEFHYARYPDADWERELLKMKAAGVNIVSTYVIWIHHEQVQGDFNWTGQRDLRRFVELCGRHGLYVFVRVGPWVHGEVRNGGLPDWVLKNSPVRENNAVYLGEVKQFYSQIGRELQGELWRTAGR